MATSEHSSHVRNTTITLAISTAAILLSSLIYGRRCKRLSNRVRELEDSLKSYQEKCAAERQGRVRAQQALRKSVTQPNGDGSKQVYPMIPIGTVQSCFSTRNGTPRQPLVVPLARARLVLDPSRVSTEALEGFTDFSHCWILYVFHLNTNLDKMWKDPSRSKIKAKVRVPRLNGGKMGVLATRSPHRPCPIGLSVAEIEAVDGHAILLSGIDLVDGTPVLDIKPYLPYSDCIRAATVPDWVQEDSALAVDSVTFSPDFSSSLSNCWIQLGRKSLYASCEEFQALINEVLTWDIRSISQRMRPHHAISKNETDEICDENVEEEKRYEEEARVKYINSDDYVVYHLILEGIDVSYRFDEGSGVIVGKAELVSKESMVT